MTLTELDALPAASLPVADLAEHLRLGTGFADEGAENAVLETYLRAALSAIEARTGKVLIARRFGWSLTAWRDGAGQALPLSPVNGIESVTLVAADGTTSVLDPAAYFLIKDDQRPVLAPAGSQLPPIADGGRCDLVLAAGFGPDWDAVPAGLAQATRLLAASFFEDRAGQGAAGGFPLAVASLLEPFRTVRIGGGGA